MANVELAEAYIALVPSMRGAETQIASQLAGVGQSAGETTSKGFLSSIGGAVGAVTGIVAKGVGLVGGLVGGLALKGGLARQLSIEDATAKLAGLGHGASEVKTIMGNALASVKGTAYGLGDAATVAAGAVAAGIKPGQDLQRILKLTADTATITGASMGEMGGIFNKVAANGKLTLGDVNQLQDRGFPILQMVAKQYGVTQEAASKMVTKGQVDFAHFADAIQAGVGGAALKSGNTTRGAFANMGAALSRLGVTATSGFFPLFKSVFNQITQILDGVNAKISPFVAAWGVAFQGKAGPIIANFSKNVLRDFNLLVGGVEALVNAFKAGGDDITSSGFAGGMERVGLTLRAATDRIKDTWALFVTGWKMPPSLASMFKPQDISAAAAFGIGLRAVVDRITGIAREARGGTMALGNAFKAGGDDITSSGFAGAMERIGLVARRAWDGAQPVFANIRIGWNALMLGLRSGDFSGVGGSVVSIFGALHNIAEPLGNVLIAVGSNVGAVSTQLGNLIAGALPLVAPLIQAAADALKFLGDHSELITPIVLSLAAAFLVYKAGQTAANIAELAALPIKAASVVSQLALASANNTLAASIAVSNGEEKAGFIARLPAVAQVIAQTAATVAHGIAVTATSVATKAAAAAQWLFNAAMDANPIMIVVIAIAALVAGVIWAYNNIGWFKDGVNAAWAFISNITMTVLGAVGAFFRGLWSGMVNFTVGGLTFLVGFVLGAWNNITGFTMAVLGALGAFFTGLWQGMVNFTVGSVSFFVGFILGAWNNITGFTMSAFLGIAAFLAGVWGGIVSGVSSMIGNLVSFFVSLPGRIMSALAGAGSWLIGVGEDIINGLISGISSMAGKIFDAVKAVIGNVVDFAKKILGIASPSKVMAAEVGHWMPAGIAAGIVGNQGVVADAIDSAVAYRPAAGRAGAFNPAPASARRNGVQDGTSTEPVAIHVHPQPGQSEEQIGEWAARKVQKAGKR